MLSQSNSRDIFVIPTVVAEWPNSLMSCPNVWKITNHQGGVSKWCWKVFTINQSNRGFEVVNLLEDESQASSWNPFSSPESLKKAKEYLEEYGVFDGHNDLPMTITYYNNTMNNDLSKVDLYKEDPLLAETTIPWIKEGKLRKVFKLIRALSLIGWHSAGKLESAK